MPKFLPHTVVVACCAAVFATQSQAASVKDSKSTFFFKDASGSEKSAEIVTKYQPKKIVLPFAKADTKIDPKLRRAATIAEERAHAHSRARCWHYVKEALLAAGVVSSYPKTAYAKEAGQELVSTYGFRKLAVRDPFKAPVGS